MKKVISAILSAAILMAASCSSDKGSTLDSSAQPHSFGDSISYFLGRTAGSQLHQEYGTMSAEEQARFSKPEFIAGLSTLLAADSITTSYVAGLSQAMQLAQMVLQMKQAGIEVNPALFIAQLEAQLQADSIDVSAIEAESAIVAALDSRAQSMIQQQALEKINENKLKAEKYLAEKRRANPSIQVTPTGLTYEVTKEGKGQVGATGSVIPAIYSATTLSGREIISTMGKPQPVDTQTTMPGIAEALTTLPAGTIATLYVPSSLAFGDQGTPDGAVLPGEMVIVQLEIID